MSADLETKEASNLTRYDEVHGTKDDRQVASTNRSRPMITDNGVAKATGIRANSQNCERTFASSGTLPMGR